MNRRLLLCLPLAAAGLFAATVNKPDPSTAEIEKIIATFAENESAFALARENYTYRQTAKIQEYDEVGTPGGKYELVSDIIFGQDSKRTERIIRAPQVTLQRIQMSPADEQDLRNVLPFVLTSKDIDKYHVRYLGRQMADEIPCYVFAVKPKSMEQGKRYFQGQIWVDDRDLMIVKSYGRSTGILKKGSDEQFAKFETYREQIDGKYWFPTFTIAQSLLHFETGDVPVKLSVRYEDYKQFKTESKIIGVQEAPAEPPPTPEKK